MAANRIGTEIFLTIHELKGYVHRDDTVQIVRWKALLIAATPSQTYDEKDCLLIDASRDRIGNYRADNFNLDLRPRIEYHNYASLVASRTLVARISLAKLTSETCLVDYERLIAPIQLGILQAPKSRFDFEYICQFWAEDLADAVRSESAKFNSLRFEPGFQALDIPKTATDIVRALQTEGRRCPKYNTFSHYSDDDTKTGPRGYFDTEWRSWAFYRARYISRHVSQLADDVYYDMPVSK